jgi:hypothetical protein
VTADALPTTGEPTDGPNGPDGTGDPAGRGDGTGGTRSRAVRVAIALAIASMLGMWGYVLYLAVGPGRQPPLDRFEDPAFAEAGEAACAEAVADVEALPQAGDADSATERADAIVRADERYAAMLDELDESTALLTDADERSRAEAWLADWRTYLADRADYAERLTTDPDARLLVSEKAGEGRQITGWIDEFALANRMDSCVTPADV